MKILEKINEMRHEMGAYRRASQRIALVPTMGNLHDGHMSLIDIAKKNGKKIVVSIFVNPLQFAPHEDFDSYPRTFDADRDKLTQAGVDVLFYPRMDALYPYGEDQQQCYITQSNFDKDLCGESRPHFFQGVSTVVAKLFNIVTPDVAVFGEKDYQQLCVIKQMVQQLSFPLEILSGPIVREEDGLAMSSRNNYLSKEERLVAPKLHEHIVDLLNRAKQDSSDCGRLESECRESLVRAGFGPDYVCIRRQRDLQKPNFNDKDLIVLAAAILGKVRLIDNVY